MIALNEAASSEKMAETHLMARVGKLPIWRPPVVSKTAREIHTEDRRGVRKAAASANGIDRCRRGRKTPTPVQQAPDLPAGSSGITTRLGRTVSHKAV